MWLYIVLLCVVAWVIDWLRRIPRVTGLHKKCVVITGCDSGFGNALAKSLYNKGVYVFAGCFTEPGAKKLTEETGERLKTFKLDVSKTESIEAAYDFVKINIPSGSVLWGLVNNAGIMGPVGPSEIITRQDMLDVMNINCFGMAEMVRVFLPLIKQSRGRIVNTASIAGIMAGQGCLPYTASKFALKGFSEALRHEKAIWGIKVSTILPGGFRTGILNMAEIKTRMDNKWDSVDPAFKQEYGDDYFDKVYGVLNDATKGHVETDLSPVVNANEHALFAWYPRHSYYPGRDAKVIAFILKWIPWAMDYILRSHWKAATPKILRQQ